MFPNDFLGLFVALNAMLGVALVRAGRRQWAFVQGEWFWRLVIKAMRAQTIRRPDHLLTQWPGLAALLPTSVMMAYKHIWFDVNASGQWVINTNDHVMLSTGHTFEQDATYRTRISASGKQILHTNLLRDAQTGEHAAQEENWSSRSFIGDTVADIAHRCTVLPQLRAWPDCPNEAFLRHSDTHILTSNIKNWRLRNTMGDVVAEMPLLNNDESWCNVLQIDGHKIIIRSSNKLVQLDFDTQERVVLPWPGPMGMLMAQSGYLWVSPIHGEACVIENGRVLCKVWLMGEPKWAGRSLFWNTEDALMKLTV